MVAVVEEQIKCELHEGDSCTLAVGESFSVEINGEEVVYTFDVFQFPSMQSPAPCLKMRLANESRPTMLRLDVSTNQTEFYYTVLKGFSVTSYKIGNIEVIPTEDPDHFTFNVSLCDSFDEVPLAEN